MLNWGTTGTLKNREKDNRSKPDTPDLGKFLERADTLSMEDIAPALQELNNIMRPNSTLHRGIYIPNEWSEQDRAKRPDLFCYVILSGMEHPEVTLKWLFEKARNYNQSYGSVGALQGTPLENAQCDTIRLKLFKVAAVVTVP